MMKSSIFAAYEDQAATSKPQAPPSQSVAVGSNVSLLNQQQQSFHQESKYNSQHMTTSRIFASPTPSPGAVIAPSKAMVQVCICKAMYCMCLLLVHAITSY